LAQPPAFVLWAVTIPPAICDAIADSNRHRTAASKGAGSWRPFPPPARVLASRRFASGKLLHSVDDYVVGIALPISGAIPDLSAHCRAGAVACRLHSRSLSEVCQKIARRRQDQPLTAELNAFDFAGGQKLVAVGRAQVRGRAPTLDAPRDLFGFRLGLQLTLHMTR
jgi:hypothetical protein